MTTVDRKLLTREILLGFWKVHILHHAAERPVVGQWILTELRHHGYDISPGTLYPLLKRMERNGWLRCEVEAGAGPRGRRYYHLTTGGAAVLDSLREHVTELHHEVIEEPAHGPRQPEDIILSSHAHHRTKTTTGAGRRKTARRPATRRRSR